jgi:hypothetical protein
MLGSLAALRADRRRLPGVTAEFVWIGESLVVLSSEEADELRRQLSEPPKNPRRRPSDAEVVNVNPEYL